MAHSAQSAYFSFPSYESHFVAELEEPIPVIPALSQNLLLPVVDTAAAAHPIIQHNSSLEAEVELILYLHGTRPGSFPVKAPSVYSQSSANSVSSSSSRFSLKSIKSWWKSG